MDAFTQYTGLAAVLNIANIDTDQIIPKQFLSKVTRDGFGVHLFHDWRYLNETGTQDNPDFELNQPKFKDASILVSGDNFGCGSSREHAPWALADYGFRAIIAPSFADIFYNNALNNGLLPISLSEQEVKQLMKHIADTHGAKIHINLTKQQVISPNHDIFSFDIASSAKHNLLHGLDAVGLTLSHQQQILDYEQNIPFWRR